MINTAILGAIAGGIGIAAIAIVFFATGFFAGPPQPQLPSGDQVGTTGSFTKEVILSLTSVEIKQVSEEDATIEVVFDVFNPNKNTMVLEAIEYELIANGIMLTQSTIGERLQGVITGTGQTYYVVPDAPLTLKDTVHIRKAERFDPIWINLDGNDVDWRIKGKYVITDPVRMGGQEKDFDFTV